MWNYDINDRLFFNRYKTKKFISKTLCCKLYEGINIKNNELVAMKFEKRKGKFNVLESEAYFLMNLKGFGIPKIKTYGIVSGYNLLIEELLGPSIMSLWKSGKKTNEKRSLKDICMISLQGLDRLEYIHSKDIIHRDIKPHNFLIGLKNPNVIYLIDFGFSRKYRSSRTGRHIQFKNLKKACGSMRYLSINGNMGLELSRRDDLESFGYMLIYLSKDNLPWISTEKLKLEKSQIIQEIYKLKRFYTPEKLCTDLPVEFREYIKYVRKLEFEEKPDYNYLKGLFISVLSRNELKNDLCFSWIINKRKELLKEQNIEDKRNVLKKKRQNSLQRLYIKIKKSLKKDIRNKEIKKIELSTDSKSDLYNEENNNNFYKYYTNETRKIEKIDLDKNCDKYYNKSLDKIKIGGSPNKKNTDTSTNISYISYINNKITDNKFDNKYNYLENKRNNNRIIYNTSYCNLIKKSVLQKKINIIKNYKNFSYNKNNSNLILNKTDNNYKTLYEREQLKKIESMNSIKTKVNINNLENILSYRNLNINIKNNDYHKYNERNFNIINNSFLIINRNIKVSIPNKLMKKNNTSKKYNSINNHYIP